MVADFENYGDLYSGVTAAQIRTAAETPSQNTTVIQGLAGELDGDDKAIAGQLEGDIEAGTRANPQNAAQLSRSLAQKGNYAIGLMNQFAAAVEVFDDKVEDLNERLRTRTQSQYNTAVHDPDVHSGDVPHPNYNDIKAQVKATLQGEYNTALQALDTATDEVASMFRNYSDENVKKLLTSGYIPLGAAGLWPNVPLTPDEKRQALQNAIDNGTLPDFATMSLEETKQYIQENPEVSAGLLEIMALPHLSPALTALVQGQAAVDADILNGVVAGDGTYNDIAESTARLQAINESIADGHKMTASEAAYIEQYLNSVGAENLAGLSTTIRNAIPSGMPPYAADSMVDQAMRPIADSILNYSNPDVQRDDAGIDSAAYLGSTLSPPDGRISLNEMPQAIQDLVNQRVGHPDGSGGLLGTAPGEETVTGGRGRGGPSTYTIETIGQEQFNTVDGLGAVNGWGDLLSSASDGVRPGDQFGVDLAHQAIEVKQDLNTIDETAESNGYYTGGGRGGQGREYHGLDFTQDDSGVSDLLGVTARNENSSSTILLEDDSRRALLTAPWGNADGAEALIHSGTDHTPGGGGDMDLQARAASELMSDIADDPIQWENRMGENMSDAVLDVGSRWIDSFGRPVTTGTPDGIGHDDGGVFAQLSNDTQDGFLKFVANSGNSNGEDPIRWQGQAQAYFDNQVREAVHNGDSDALREALRRAGDFDGRMRSATIDWASDRTEGEHANEVAEIIEENRRRAATATSINVLSGIAGTGLGFVPGAGPFLSGAVGTFTGPIVDEVLGEQDVPNYDEIDDENRDRLLQDARRDADSQRNIRIASWYAGQYANDPDYSSIYNADGSPKSYYEASQDSSVLSDMSRLADNAQDDWNDATGDSFSFNDTYDDSFDTSLENANADNDMTDEDGEAVDPDTDVRDDEAMRRYLYGRNLDNWYDANPQGQAGPATRGRTPAAPENDWSPQEDHVGTDR